MTQDEKIADIIDTLKRYENISYTLQIHKHKDSDDLKISVCVSVDVGDDTDVYFRILHDVHDDIQKQGFLNIVLQSCATYANIWGEMIIQ